MTGVGVLPWPCDQSLSFRISRYGVMGNADLQTLDFPRHFRANRNDAESGLAFTRHSPLATRHCFR